MNISVRQFTNVFMWLDHFWTHILIIGGPHALLFGDNKCIHKCWGKKKTREGAVVSSHKKNEMENFVIADTFFFFLGHINMSLFWWVWENSCEIKVLYTLVSSWTTSWSCMRRKFLNFEFLFYFIFLFWCFIFPHFILMKRMKQSVKVGWIRVKPKSQLSEMFNNFTLF